ncbi:sulfotransferase 2A1-like [Castor canadensis]|uniref:Sulfotransferase 2A1-like n=2 Tax=Castor canadensis TaxID=51338 RepID=A0AC58L9X0_CASCN
MYDDYLWIEGIPFLCVWFKPEIIREVHDNFVVKDEDIVDDEHSARATQRTEPGEHGPVLNPFHLDKMIPPDDCTVTCELRGDHVIYLIRNPRNVAVSGYFFWKKLNVCKIAKSWDEYFEWFIQGKVPYG